ncbi:MAG: PEP-CTERM sorting domain-containing protein [Gemmatimonadaceae bacterium]
MTRFNHSFPAVALVAAFVAVSSAHAQVVSSDIGKAMENVQTGPTTVTPFNGAASSFFFARSFYANPTDFDGGQLTFGGPDSPQDFNLSGALDCCGHQGRGFQTGYLSQADVDAMFPTGLTYTLTSTNSAMHTSQSVGIDFAKDLFSAETPTYTAATYAAFQSIDPTAGLTIDFNSFVQLAGAGFAQGFLTIYDITAGTGVANFAGFASSTTSLFVNPGTFTAGHSYSSELIFDEGVQDGSDIYRSDNRTLAFFDVPSTMSAAPEPATWAMLLTGMGVLGIGSRRRRGNR